MNAAHCPIAIIAEDEDLGRLLLSEAALAAGLTAHAFDNGLSALQAATTLDPAIIFLDVDMPGADGYTVCSRIREHPQCASIPIVMVTGHDDTGAINRAFNAGATDYISKPVNWALLPHRIAYILRNAASVRALADREAKVSALVEAIPDALWVVSATGQLRWSPNDPAARGTESGVVSGTTPGLQSTLPADALAQTLLAVRVTASDGLPRKLEYREPGTADSKLMSAELRFSRCDDGDVLIVRQDTTERTTAAAHIEQLAYFDSLTGLPNREQCMALGSAQLARISGGPEQMAVIYLDMNGFKRINDTFGRSVSDIVVREVASRLTNAVAPFERDGIPALISRLGGDEFVVLVRDPAARQKALQVAGACLAALKEPVGYEQMEFSATASVGVSVYPEDGRDMETLLKHADTAMYHAKTNALSEVVVYTPAMSARLRDALELESRLRRALRDDVLTLCFQPKLRLHDTQLVGVEALMRWVDAEFGEIAPTRFIPVAERSGLIVDMGAWMIGAVCRQLRDWLDRGIAIPIAINLSGKELLYGDPARILEAEMKKHQVPASLIEVEITESVFITDATAGNSSIDRLRQLGCRIALDDFGTGFSSLSYLTRFPPDRLKIDRSFILNVDRSDNDAAVVNAIMSLAKSLNLVVTAEGIERTGQLEWLRARGCHEAQGYLLARPMSGSELERRFLCEPTLNVNRWPDSATAR